MLKHKNNDIGLSLPSLKCHLNQFLFADSYNKLRPIIDKTEKVTFDANISTNMTLLFIAWIKELFLLANADFYWRSNYADPVYGVGTICHQVRCLGWGHPSLFHTAMSRLIWYKMFCMRDISYRLIWMEYINMLFVYAQSGTHRPFNWWIIAVFT